MDRFGQPRHDDNGSMTTDISRLRDNIPHSAHDWTLIDERVASGEPARELVKKARQIETDLVVDFQKLCERSKFPGRPEWLTRFLVLPSGKETQDRKWV